MLGRFLRELPEEHEVLVLCSGDASDFFRRAGTRVTTLPLLDAVGGVTRRLSVREAAPASIRVARGMRELSRAIGGCGHDVVITNSMKAHILVPRIARRHARRVGIRLHDILTPGSTSRTARILVQRAGRAAHSIAAVSRAAAHAAAGVGLRDVRFFYNGVDLPELTRKQPSRALRLLSVSHFVPWKGIHNVLEALAVARASGVDATLDVVGDAAFGSDEYSRELRRRGRQLGLEEVVRWHGRTDPTAHYREADAFIHLPEMPDPLPTVVLEAQAWALPVIARRVGGIGEIVIDGETGLLTSDADPGAAARVIAELSDDALRSRLAMAARDRIREHFSAQRYVETFQEWIATLGAAAGARRV